MTLNEKAFVAMAEKRVRAKITHDVLDALSRVHEHYYVLNITTAIEAVSRCREAVREVLEKKD